MTRTHNVQAYDKFDMHVDIGDDNESPTMPRGSCSCVGRYQSGCGHLSPAPACIEADREGFRYETHGQQLCKTDA